MEDELYHGKAHKYLKKVLGKNGIVRYIYKISSERAFNNAYKEQKKAQVEYNSALKDYKRALDVYRQYDNQVAELEKKRKEAEKQADRAFHNHNFDEWREKNEESSELFEQISELKEKSFDAETKAMFAKSDADYQASLIKMYYETGKAARQSYLDFVEDSESLLKQVKGKSFLSGLFSRKNKKKK